LDHGSVTRLRVFNHDVTGQSLVGKVGQVVRAVRGGNRPGEVRVVVEGVPHYYLAYCAHPIPADTTVLVINARGARQIDVEPWSQPGH
jgi:membrane protein implicated in regulation of membrane protease activity